MMYRNFMSLQYFIVCVTLTLQQQRRRPAGSNQPASSSSSSRPIGLLQSKSLL